MGERDRMQEALAQQVPHSRSVLDKETTADLTAYFAQCDENRSILRDIYVAVPVRPSDGMNCVLHRMLAIWYGESTAFTDVQDAMAGFIEHQRANIAGMFLREPPINPETGKPCKYLLMIDNDMEPPINLPYLLARHDKPVVGVCAMSVDKEWGPQLCFSIMDDEGKARFPCLRSGQPIPATGLKEVVHAGTGAMLIRRDVLESFDWGVAAKAAMAKHKSGEQLTHDEVEALISPDIPFFCPQEGRIIGMSEGNIKVGEDIHFCNQLRRKGIKVYVDLEAHVGHRKTLTLQWDETLTDPYLKADKWVSPRAGKVIHSL